MKTVRHDHVVEIVSARLEEVFELVRKELVTSGKDKLLPAGAVLTGGGTNLVYVVDLAKDLLELPVQIGYADGLLGVIDHVDDPSHATAVGLILWQEEFGEASDASESILGGVGQGAATVVESAHNMIKRFLP